MGNVRSISPVPEKDHEIPEADRDGFTFPSTYSGKTEGKSIRIEEGEAKKAEKRKTVKYTSCDQKKTDCWRENRICDCSH